MDQIAGEGEVELRAVGHAAAMLGGQVDGGDKYAYLIRITISCLLSPTVAWRYSSLPISSETSMLDWMALAASAPFTVICSGRMPTVTARLLRFLAASFWASSPSTGMVAPRHLI